MSGWEVVNPASAARQGTKLVRVDVPYFPDHIEYEDILGRAFTDPVHVDFFASGGVVVLATPDGYDKLKRVMDGAVDSPESTVRSELVKLALTREIVALRWFR